MKYLLDTHTYLWAINASPQLSPRAQGMIRAGDSELLLSVGSLWEMAVKLSIGKLELDMSFTEVAVELPAANGVAILPITVGHLDIVSRLPLHHRDPFDRLLVAQCIGEGIPIVSNDGALDAYGIDRRW